MHERARRGGRTFRLTSLSVQTGPTSFISSLCGEAGHGYVDLMLIVVLPYLALGMFMEPFGAMLVTLPVLLPVLEAGRIDLFRFGVFVVKMLEIGMITPPVGMRVFVDRNVAGEYATVVEIFRGVVPFLLADIGIVVVIIAFPGLVLDLPSQLQWSPPACRSDEPSTRELEEHLSHHGFQIVHHPPERTAQLM